ncbi:MAG: bifunctional folylpolyglutamate synthase/dihydrofolate synthase, partial [Actinomyces oris]|uniref:bifunctional folylpolyglutamate synthase/dihydrofolate synthase n=1 Tax=Actinomyces oris TaxID=544580 RepID=UPI00361D8895
MPVDDDSKQVRPGAAFGIPEGATGEEVVDAVFGEAGIDPELLPYLEAAGAPGPAEGLTVSVSELQEAGAQQQADAEAQDREDLEALRELVAANMIPGGGTDRLEELLAEVDADDSDDWESWEPQLPDDSQGEHLRDLQAAARGVEVAARMRQVEAEILARAPEHQVQPSLERVEAVLDLLGNPERTYRTVHITGTNGKTSTARMTERLLAAGGMRTGRFTSPHLATIRERISLDGEPISEEGFIAAWEDVAPYVAMVDERSQAAGGPRLSFFEVLAVMALAAFADYPVDVAVIEVGLGGRWDATNVIGSDVAVITPIGRDHERWLGSSITEIAHEKAGIIKDGSTVIVAHQVPEAAAEIEQAVASHRAVVRRERDPQEDPTSPEAGVLQVLDRQLAVGGQMVTFATAAAVYEDVFVPLHGEYQAHNALLALAAAEAVHGGRRLPARIVEDGFA